MGDIRFLIWQEPFNNIPKIELLRFIKQLYYHLTWFQHIVSLPHGLSISPQTSQAWPVLIDLTLVDQDTANPNNFSRDVKVKLVHVSA